MTPVVDVSDRICSVDECGEPAVVVHQNTLGTGRIVHVGYCGPHWSSMVWASKKSRRWSKP